MTRTADRREFLRNAVFVGAGLLLGCGGEGDSGTGAGGASGDGFGGGDGHAGPDTGNDTSSAPDGGTTADSNTPVDAGFAQDSGPSPTDAVHGDTGGFADIASGDAGTTGCPNPLAGGQLLGLVPFIQEGGKLMATKYGVGWDGRYYCDLTKLNLDTMINPISEHFIRTRYPDQIDTTKPWKLTIGGLVDAPKTLAMADISPLTKDMGVHLMECSGNGKGGKFGLISAAKWKGVPVPKLLAMVKPKAAGKRVLIKGFDGHSTPSENNHSKPGASWIFTPEQLENAFLATEMNSKPLPEDHGKPVRLLVPGWYGCCNIKWVTDIQWVQDDAKSTSQMKEFASRTHQTAAHALAKSFKPATMDQVAMPIRVERWKLADGTQAHMILGVMWGGYELTEKLAIEFSAPTKGPLHPVEVCPKQATNQTWTLWRYLWNPKGPMTAQIRMRIDDPKIPTRRLDMGWYKRTVKV